MKKLFYLLIVITLFYSCSQENPSLLKSESKDVSFETRGVKSFGSVFKNDDQFLVLKINGDFESNIEDAPNAGKWEVTSEGRVLKLTSLNSNEGKGKTVISTYNILEMTDDRVWIVNSLGKEIDLRSN